MVEKVPFPLFGLVDWRKLLKQGWKEFDIHGASVTSGIRPWHPLELDAWSSLEYDKWR